MDYCCCCGKSLVKKLAHVSIDHTLRLDIYYIIIIIFLLFASLAKDVFVCVCFLNLSTNFYLLSLTPSLSLYLSRSVSMLICFQTLSLIYSQRTRRLFCFVFFLFVFFLLHFQLAFCKIYRFFFCCVCRISWKRETSSLKWYA